MLELELKLFLDVGINWEYVTIDDFDIGEGETIHYSCISKVSPTVK